MEPRSYGDTVGQGVIPCMPAETERLVNMDYVSILECAPEQHSGGPGKTCLLPVREPCSNGNMLFPGTVLRIGRSHPYKPDGIPAACKFTGKLVCGICRAIAEIAQ